MKIDVTVIRGKLAAKTICADGSEGYDLGYRVDACVERVDGLFGLYDLLKRLERDPTRCIVRGKPRGARHLNRRYLAKEGKEAPSFEATDVGWFCLDLDKVPAPEDFDPHDPLATVDLLLPEPLQGRSLIWQYSASQGLAGKEGLVSAHLWFVCDRPVACKSIKAWLKSLDAGDLSLFNPVQPHYTARPIFKGVDDPLPRRLFLSADELPVTLPASVITVSELEAKEARERDRRARELALARRRTSPHSSSAGLTPRYALAALASATQKILNAGEGGRHATIRAEAWSTYRFVSQGLLSAPAWESELRAAAETVLPPHRHGDIDRLIEGAKHQQGDV